MQRFVLGLLIFCNFAIAGVTPPGKVIQNAVQQTDIGAEEGRKILSQEEKDGIYQLVESAYINNVPAYALTDETHPRVRVFYAAFDGTNNDREDIPKGEKPSIVAEMERTLVKPSNGFIQSKYYEGVGTRTLWPVNLVQQALGLGAKERAERAYKDLQLAIEGWRSKATTDFVVHIHAIGFSRGSASVSHFLNLVHENGVDGKSGVNHRMVEGLGFRQTACIIDLVATGQRDSLKLGLPGSVVGVLHLTAADERRRAFSLTSVNDPAQSQTNWVRAENVPTTPAFSMGSGYPVTDSKAYDSSGFAVYQRVHEIVLPGAVHSDAGGTYGSGGIRNASGYLFSAYEEQLGLIHRDESGAALFPKPTKADIQEYFAHDSRWNIDKFLDHVAGNHKRGVFEGQSSSWNGGALLFLKSAITPSLQYNQLWEDMVLDKGTPPEAFKEEYSLKVWLDENQHVRFTGYPVGAFTYDVQGDRMLFLGKSTEILGVTKNLTSHLRMGGMSFIFVLQRNNFVYDPEHDATPRQPLPEEPIGL